MKKFSILEILKEFDSEEHPEFVYSALLGYIKGTLESDYANPKDKIKYIENFISDFEELKKWKEKNKH